MVCAHQSRTPERSHRGMSANRAVVIDRWMNKDGKRTGRYGVGMCWRARFVDDQGFSHLCQCVLVRGFCPGAKPKRRVCPLVSHGADSVDELCPSGFESSAVTGDRWLGEFGGCEL